MIRMLPQYLVLEHSLQNAIQDMINVNVPRGYELFSFTVTHNGNQPTYTAVMKQKEHAGRV
jgi:hypothetical protein